MKKEEEEEIYITKEKEMDKQGKAISAKKWYIRQEAVIFFFCLPHNMWVRLKKLKTGFFFCCCFRHGALSLWLGLGFTFLCSGFYHKESWKFEI